MNRASPLERRTELERRTSLARTGMSRASGPVSPATPAQRRKVEDLACIVCGARPVQPAHVIDRSLAASAGDDIRAVIPLDACCHRDYDEGKLDLSPYLEPRWRAELAWAVEALGLFGALRRITGRKWVPAEDQPSTERQL